MNAQSLVLERKENFIWKECDSYEVDDNYVINAFTVQFLTIKPNLKYNKMN
jgi:hypothetical protein